MIYTVGHSTRKMEGLKKLLNIHGIKNLVDVRHSPYSKKFPWFNTDKLEKSLAKEGINYIWIEELGGFRKGGYREYRKTGEYKKGIEKILYLVQNSSSGPTAIMCAEYKWWKCHRRYISDTLKDLGFLLKHIMNENRVDAHKKKENTLRCDLF